MRAIVQRSKKSSVKVESETVGAIDYGMVILVGFTEGDTEEIIEKIYEK